MDDAAGCLGGLFILALVAVGVGIGGLLLTSKAVLYSETKVDPPNMYVSFDCWYFTGLRTVERTTSSDTGCVRFIDVGK